MPDPHCLHPSPSAAQPALPWHEVLAHRRDLLRYARRRLQDPALAEDAVHDVFMAVLDGRARYAGRSTLRSWLIGVLRHKIVDLIRTRSGHDSLDALGDDDDAAGELICTRGRPDELAEQRERLARTLEDIESLALPLRRAMQLRVLQDGAVDEVCRSLAITADTLHVRLHRARRRLIGVAA